MRSQRVTVGFHVRGVTEWNQPVAILAQDGVPVGKTGLVSWVVVRVTGPRRDQGSLLGVGTNFGGPSLPVFSPVTSCGSRPRRALGCKLGPTVECLLARDAERTESP